MKCHVCNKVFECKSCCPIPTSAQNELQNNVINVSNSNQVKQPIIPTPSFTIAQLLSGNEIDQLLRENYELKNRIAIYEGNLAILTANITSKNLEIEILKRENQELREKIKSLENSVKSHEVTIKSHADTINSHEDTIKSHGLEIRELKINRALESYIIAIQDLNRKKKLESKLAAPVGSQMTRLRKIRLLQCHFIDDNDSEEEILSKYRSIYTHLKSMSTELKNELESRVCKDYTNRFFVNSILDYLEKLPSFESSQSIDDSQQSEIDDFWSW